MNVPESEFAIMPANPTSDIAARIAKDIEKTLNKLHHLIPNEAASLLYGAIYKVLSEIPQRVELCAVYPPVHPESYASRSLACITDSFGAKSFDGDTHIKKITAYLQCANASASLYADTHAAIKRKAEIQKEMDRLKAELSALDV